VKKNNTVITYNYLSYGQCVHFFGIDYAIKVANIISPDGTIMKVADKILNLTTKPAKIVASLNSGDGYITLAEAPVNFDGSFLINLPDIVLGYSYLYSPEKACKDLDIYSKSLKIAIIDTFWLLDSYQKVIGYAFQGSTQESINRRLGEKLVSRWYANQRSQIRSTANCGSRGMNINFKLDLKKGWNDVVRCRLSNTQENIQTCNNTESMYWFMSEGTSIQKPPPFERFLAQQ
jgi:hypothetical protein